MAVAAAKIPVAGRNSFSDMVFGFLDDGEELPAEGFGSSCESQESETTAFDEQDEEKESSESVEESKTFWETQNQILQATICRTNSLESKIRNATKEAVKEIQASGGACGCGRSVLSMSGCRSCLMREVSGRLRNAGYDSAVCKTKWRSSQHIPSGEHTFLDVVHNSKKGEIRFIIELNFRAEFEMARASEEYSRLVGRLPEIFVGKVEKLAAATKVVCGSAKKCMKEKKMHLGPWRKGHGDSETGTLLGAAENGHQFRRRRRRIRRRGHAPGVPAAAPAAAAAQSSGSDSVRRILPLNPHPPSPSAIAMFALSRRS